jgi:hypothetical protein
MKFSDLNFRTNKPENPGFNFEVEHTQSPLIGNFGALVDLGAITMDYLLHEEPTPSGGRRAGDHGYLFKIHPDNLDLLFPPSKTYQLC